MREARSTLRNVDDEHSAFDAHRIRSNGSHGGTAQNLARVKVELGTVPRTCDNSARHRPSLQRAAPMRTAGVYRAELSTDIEHGHRKPPRFRAYRMAGGRGRSLG